MAHSTYIVFIPPELGGNCYLVEKTPDDDINERVFETTKDINQASAYSQHWWALEAVLLSQYKDMLWQINPR